MKSIRPCLLCLALILVAGAVVEPAGIQEDAGSTEEPIRVDVNLVNLRFTVRTSDGVFLNGLEQSDFEVYENGELQEIAFFQKPRRSSGEQPPLWLAILLDVSGSTFATRAEEILAARSFFDNVHSFTRVGIFGFTDELLQFQDFTSNRGLALEAFSSARTHLGKTAIYASLNRLIAEMNARARPEDRRAIILVSDGLDDQYRDAWKSAALARANDLAVYTIWVPSAAQLYVKPTTDPSSGNDDDRSSAKEEAFEHLAVETGGRHFGGFETILNFDHVLADINDELFGNLYQIGYYTERPYLDRAERRIAVQVQDPSAEVHGLFKDVPDRIESKRRYIEALFDNAALGNLADAGDAFREIGADVDLLRPRREGDRTTLPIRIKISPFSLQRDHRGNVRTQFGVVGLLTDRAGNEVVRLREVFRAQLDAGEIRDGRGIIYNNRLPAPPGHYYLKLVLLEIPTWRMTVMERPVQLRDPGP